MWRTGNVGWLVLLAIAGNVSTAVGSTVIGRDNRGTESYLTPDEETKYSAIGQIVCPIPGQNKISIGSGFLAVSDHTVLTVSHNFFKKKTVGETYREPLVPQTCRFDMYSRAGILRDSIAIKSVIKLWDLFKVRDIAYDFAIVRLERRPKFGLNIPALGDGRKQINKPIKLISFHGDVDKINIPRSLKGTMYEADDRDIRENGELMKNDKKNIFFTDADTGPGSSGGMYVDVGTGVVIGIHKGGAETYNYGLFLTKDIVNSIRMIAIQE